jgi:Cleft lip and palate transmembrane protein 1 (CLPTM1)
LYLHTQIKFKNPFYLGPKDSDFLGSDGEIVGTDFKFRKYEYLTFNQTLPLVKYLPKIKENTKRNLLSDDMPMPTPKKTEEEDDGKYHSYFKKELYLYLIYDP